MSGILTAGEAMVLLLADGPAPLTEATSFSRSVAGSESNVAVGLARLGHPVTFVGRVGDDTAGRWVRDTLRGEGVDIGHLATDPEAHTALLMRDRADDARPAAVEYFRRGSAGSRLDAGQLRRVPLTQSTGVFVSGITAMLSPSSQAFVEALFTEAERAGVPIFFDPNVRPRLADAGQWREVVLSLMTRATTVLVGEDELEFLGLPLDAASHLGPVTTTVVLKGGARGVEVVTRADRFTEPARAVAVVDTVGAGDAFAAGWISAVTRGMSHREAARVAVLVASRVVASPDDTSGFPTRGELDALLPNGARDDD